MARKLIVNGVEYTYGQFISADVLSVIGLDEKEKDALKNQLHCARELWDAMDAVQELPVEDVKDFVLAEGDKYRERLFRGTPPLLINEKLREKNDTAVQLFMQILFDVWEHVHATAPNA